MTSERPKRGKGGEETCGMSGRQLQRAFDREDKSVTEAVAVHVADCDPCTTSLVLLQAQRDAVQFLLASSAQQSTRSAVERILATTARAGREQLANLLYEMAKACLVLVPNLRRRVERRVEPRGATMVASEIGRVASRLGTTSSGVTMVYQPNATATEGGALSTARTSLQILENVEGPSERQCLAMSQVLIFDGRPDESELLLRSLLARAESLKHCDLAEWNLMLSLMRQLRYQDAVKFGEEAIARRPDDSVILYNLAACRASLRQSAEFDEVSARLAILMSNTERGAPEWLINLVRFEAPNFAECLNRSVQEIERRFGLALSKPEDRS